MTALRDFCNVNGQGEFFKYLFSNYLEKNCRYDPKTWSLIGLERDSPARNHRTNNFVESHNRRLKGMSRNYN